MNLTWCRILLNQSFAKIMMFVYNILQFNDRVSHIFSHCTNLEYESSLMSSCTPSMYKNIENLTGLKLLYQYQTKLISVLPHFLANGKNWKTYKSHLHPYDLCHKHKRRGTMSLQPSPHFFEAEIKRQKCKDFPTKCAITQMKIILYELTNQLLSAKTVTSQNW